MITRATRSIVLALALMGMPALPAFAQPIYQTPTVTKTFNLTLGGDVPAGESFGIDYAVQGGSEQAPLYFCGPDVGTPCTGNGTVHTQSVKVPQNAQLMYHLYRGHKFSAQYEEIRSGQELMTVNSTTNAAYTFAPAASATPSTSPVPSTPTPADEVTLTFNLTVNGAVPAGTSFTVDYGQELNRAVDTLCSTATTPCAGNGTVYTKHIRVARGSTITHAFRVAPSAASGEFSGNTATINADTTYNAVYTFAAASPSASAKPSTSATPSTNTKPSASTSAKPISASAKPSVKASAPPAQLPDTGAPALPLSGVIGVGVALLTGGVAIRKR